MTLIIDLQYFPSIILYTHLNKVSHIVFDSYEPYKKLSFCNRTLIAGSNGVIKLSVPLTQGRHQKGPIKDIRISNKNPWQSQHWKTILSCYNRSPWFEHYRDEFAQLYQKSHEFLIEWNLACFEWSITKLDLPISLGMRQSFGEEYEGANYLDSRNSLSLKNYKEFKPIVYKQVFEEGTGFLPNLSILDLLFCEGKHASELLKLQIKDQQEGLLRYKRSYFSF